MLESTGVGVVSLVKFEMFRFACRFEIRDIGIVVIKA